MLGRHHHVVPRPGESRPFHFESEWAIHAPVEQAWQLLTDVGGWPEWWRGMDVLSLLDIGAEHGVGNRARLVARSPAGFHLNFDVQLTAVEPLRRLGYEADGDLRGTGTWTCAVDGPRTRMEIVWCVVSGRLPIRLSRPLAAWAHDRIMRRGEAGLNAVLQAPPT